MLKILLRSRASAAPLFRSFRNLHYIQGQSPEPNIREYFYYIDHQGQLFLHDARIKNFTSCFKEKRFIEFFFKRLRLNKTQRYPDFPYISLCGRERNFISCDDKPIVYLELVKDSATTDYLYYGGYKADLKVPFEPTELCMLPSNGRVYYPTKDLYGGIGLIKSKIAIELSQYFVFENGELEPPTHIDWNNQRHELSNKLLPLLGAKD
ncbi:UPF0598 protein CG30010 [Octopus sinensis]|uniref:UPF0598 protein CG30010 n=1 Tax=Octopus sinensis TaxID=2607531 RepID=A0A6P7S9M7_9MOLL|nr:UPF0598 protein CG30010 [Octopus sinensis]